MVSNGIYTVSKQYQHVSAQHHSLVDNCTFQHRLTEAYAEELSRLEARKWAELDQERIRAQEAVSHLSPAPPHTYWLDIVEN